MNGKNQQTELGDFTTTLRVVPVSLHLRYLLPGAGDRNTPELTVAQ